MTHVRKTFARVIHQEHPDAEAVAFTSQYFVAPDERDHAIAADLAHFLEKGRVMLGKSDGEWKWVNEHERGTYMTSIRQQRSASLPVLLANMFRSDATYGLVTPSYSNLDPSVLKHQILADLDTCYEFTALKDISVLFFEQSWGNPFGLSIHGKVLAPDSARHYYFAEKLMALMSGMSQPRIVEIGGGYGGLALILQRLHYNGSYVIVDLFETALLQYYFLRKAGLKVTFVLDPCEAPESDTIAIVPTGIGPEFLARFTDIGVVFNSRSFSEMSPGTVENYFELIQERLKPEFIHHENSNFLLFPNSVRHLEVLASEFPIDRHRYRLVQMNVSPFAGGSGRYREFLYERLAVLSGFITSLGLEISPIFG